MSADTDPILIRMALLHDLKDFLPGYTNPHDTGHENNQEYQQFEKAINSTRTLLLNDLTNNPSKDPLLRCIFPRIQFDDNRPHQPDLFYKPGILSIDQNGSGGFFPGSQQNTDNEEVYQKICDGFTDEYKPNNHGPTTLLYLLKKYTTTTPSPIPYVSYYDYAKILTALVLARYKSDSKELPFLFIAGDLSGIQDFIYNVANPAEERKKMAKRLRGRSFWLSLFMDAVADQIVRDLSLYEGSILWNTGGNFLILAPNTEANSLIIEKIRININTKLLDNFGGKIYLAMDMQECGSKGVQKFSETRDKLAIQIEARKRQKFIECGHAALFEPKGKNDPLTHFCIICNSHQVVINGKCQSCIDHENIGQGLARAKYMIKGTGFPLNFDDFHLSSSFHFIQANELVPPPKNGETIYAINDTRKFPVDGWTTSGFQFIANTVPLYWDETIGKDEIFSFNEIAQFAKGARKLGYLKADVDDLGKIFSLRMSGHTHSLPEIHGISSAFQFFFAGWLNTICKGNEFIRYNLCEECQKNATKIQIDLESDETGQKKGKIATFWQMKGNAKPCKKCLEKSFPLIYINYSGGDDLLIIGPYDAIIGLAGVIYGDFRLFTGTPIPAVLSRTKDENAGGVFIGINPNITLSAGIAIENPKFPVSRAVAAADAHLNLAKHLITEKKHRPQKNRISFFDECIPWTKGMQESGYYDLIEVARKLETDVEEKKISMGFINALLILWKWTFSDTEDIEHYKQIAERCKRKKFVPYLKYAIVRNLSLDTGKEHEKTLTENFPWIKIPVYWTSMRNRK